MRLRLKTRDDLFRDRNKFISFLFKLMMAVSYPFRRPLIFFPVLLLLYLAPTFNGVKPTEVHVWYWDKIKAGTGYVAEIVGGTAKKLIGKADMTFIKNSPFAGKGTDKLVEMPNQRAKNIRRQIFEKAQGAPQGVDIMQEKQTIEVAAPILVPSDSGGEEVGSAAVHIAVPASSGVSLAVSDENSSLNDKPDDSYRRDVPSLVYLNRPKIVNGNVTVYDANTIDVDGNYIILFGVYANPETADGVKAKQYMEKMFEGKPIVCKVVAYTYDKMPTAICYAEGMNINKNMVIKGFSKNVAL